MALVSGLYSNRLEDVGTLLSRALWFVGERDGVYSLHASCLSEWMELGGIMVTEAMLAARARNIVNIMSWQRGHEHVSPQLILQVELANATRLPDAVPLGFQQPLARHH